jgi:hypothetical protein
MVSQVPNHDAAFAALAVKYVQGASVADKKKSILSDVTSTAAFGTVFTGVGVANSALKSKKFGLDAFTKGTEVTKDVLGAASKVGKKAGKDATKLAKEMGMTGKLAKEAGKEAGKVAAKDAATTAISVAKEAGGQLIKPGKLLSKIPGITKLTNTGAGQAFLKSGGPLMVAFDMAVSTLTEIIPAFKNLGAKDGVAQVGKSLAKAGAYAAGYAGGAALGAKIGTAAIPIPIVGTAIGAVLGMAGGALCQAIMKKFTGKDASEKIAAKKEAEQAQQIAADPESMALLKQLTAEKISQEIATGNVSKDTKLMAQVLEAAVDNPAAPAAAPAASTVATTATPEPLPPVTTMPWADSSIVTNTSSWSAPQAPAASNPIAAGAVPVSQSLYAIPQEQRPNIPGFGQLTVV